MSAFRGIMCTLCTAALCGSSCSDSNGVGASRAEKDTAMSALPEGVVATVGSVAIPASLVARIAARQGVTPRLALDREVFDALLESGARQLGYVERPEVRAAIRGVLTRARLEALRARTSAGDVERGEVEEATARHFVELDRPEAFRVTHALIKLPSAPTEEVKRRARAVAEALATSLVGAKDEADFKSRAQSFAHPEGFEVIVESLQPVAADGRVVDVENSAAGGSYEESFARAASRLQHVGEQSSIVSTSFGFHVLMLLERLPAHTVPYPERASSLHDEILTLRSKNARARLAHELRAQRGVEIERSADSLIASVDVAPHEAP